ncbi:hypothetical protein CYOC110262_03410 [Cytobacillus oceanisediminis]|uniref:Uncharacterized protein n=1 Tax=Cytobacillus oceanisediminis TaxID=665099 RepID=A0A562K0T5_9BACI|nr:hypothetical protein IQ19_01447 [Cytobacillus oceanisediminis]
MSFWKNTFIKIKNFFRNRKKAGSHLGPAFFIAWRLPFLIGQAFGFALALLLSPYFKKGAHTWTPLILLLFQNFLAVCR